MGCDQVFFPEATWVRLPERPIAKSRSATAVLTTASVSVFLLESGEGARHAQPFCGDGQ